MSTRVPVALTAPTRGAGPQWGMQSDDLNATLIDWPTDGGVPTHVNDELDVLVLVLEGSVSVSVDGTAHALSGGELLLVPRGTSRTITAGPGGVRYLSIHRRRDPLLPA